jgi:cell division transport system permease protein
MTIWTRSAYVLRRAGRLCARRPRLALWAIGAVTAALTALAIARVAEANVDRWTSSWHGGAAMVVYLTPGATEARGQELAGALRTVDGVERVEYVAPEEAGARLRAALGGHDDLLAGVAPGALPASLEVTLAPGVRDVAAASPMIEALRAADGVDDVELTGDWVDRVGAVLSSLRAAAWALLFVLGAAAVWVVAATLRLRMEGVGLGDEHRVARLLGAAPRFTRMPALVAGAMQGAIGAVLALGVAWGLWRGFADRVVGGLAHVMGAGGGFGSVSFLAVGQAMVIVAVGAGLGLVGGALARPRARA